MKARFLVIMGILAAIAISYGVYSEIPQYGATVTGAPKTNPTCKEIIQHGFFSEVSILEELILDHIKNPDSRLALEIPFYEIDFYRNFMMEHFDEVNPSCFLYEYNDKQYDVMISIGPKSYFIVTIKSS